MIRLMLIALVVVGCGDNVPPDVHLVTAPDAALDVPPDACMREPSAGCCELLPDQNAVRSCAIAGILEPGACGVAVCWLATCELLRINFCVPMHDAGIDGGT